MWRTWHSVETAEERPVTQNLKHFLSICPQNYLPTHNLFQHTKCVFGRDFFPATPFLAQKHFTGRVLGNGFSQELKAFIQEDLSVCGRLNSTTYRASGPGEHLASLENMHAIPRTVPFSEKDLQPNNSAAQHPQSIRVFSTSFSSTKPCPSLVALS